MMKNTFYIKLAAVLGGLAVAIGAFGAHGLEATLVEHGRVDTFETAVKYHFYHALAILLTGVLVAIRNEKMYRYGANAFFLGIMIFSGSLYTLSLTNMSWLGAVTPLGGLAFIIGWVLLFIGAGKKSQ